MGDLVIPHLEVILTGLDLIIVGRDVLNQLYQRLEGPVGEFAFQLTPFNDCGEARKKHLLPRTLMGLVLLPDSQPHG